MFVLFIYSHCSLSPGGFEAVQAPPVVLQSSVGCSLPSTPGLGAPPFPWSHYLVKNPFFSIQNSPALLEGAPSFKGCVLLCLCSPAQPLPLFPCFPSSLQHPIPALIPDTVPLGSCFLHSGTFCAELFLGFQPVLWTDFTSFISLTFLIYFSPLWCQAAAVGEGEAGEWKLNTYIYIKWKLNTKSGRVGIAGKSQRGMGWDDIILSRISLSLCISTKPNLASQSF